MAEEGRETTGERERRLRKREREQAPVGDELGLPTAPAAYNYRTDLGMYGDRRYQYQVGDEFSHPGPEPPRDSPEWPAWKAHAAAWRRYIGQAQTYTDQMIGAGYDPEDLGIFNRKEEGMAGYKRLSPEYINTLRRRSEEYMRGADVDLDPVTGLYSTGNGSDRAYYDARGMIVNAQGQRTGRGFYGMQNTVAQFGPRAVPQTMDMAARAARPGPRGPAAAAPAPAPSPIAQPAVRPTLGANALTTTRPRNKRNPYQQYYQSPYGI